MKETTNEKHDEETCQNKSAVFITRPCSADTYATRPLKSTLLNLDTDGNFNKYSNDSLVYMLELYSIYKLETKAKAKRGR